MSSSFFVWYKTSSRGAFQWRLKDKKTGGEMLDKDLDSYKQEKGTEEKLSGEFGIHIQEWMLCSRPANRVSYIVGSPTFSARRRWLSFLCGIIILCILRKFQNTKKKIVTFVLSWLLFHTLPCCSEGSGYGRERQWISGASSNCSPK